MLKKNNQIPFLFVHGYTDSLTMFDFIFDRFYNACHPIINYPIITFDIRGHGESQIYNTTNFTLTRLTLDVIEVLDYYSVETAIWVGFSLGGMISINAAIEYPDYMDKLIILSSGPYLSTFAAELLATDSYVNTNTCIDHNIYTGGSTIQDYVALGLTQAQAGKVQTDIYKVGTAAGKSIALALIEANLTSGRIASDLLVMSSSTDFYFPPYIISQLISMVEGMVTSYNTFVGGHHFWWYQPNIAIQYIINWLDLTC